MMSVSPVNSFASGSSPESLLNNVQPSNNLQDPLLIPSQHRQLMSQGYPPNGAHNSQAVMNNFTSMGLSRTIMGQGNITPRMQNGLPTSHRNPYPQHAPFNQCYPPPPPPHHDPLHGPHQTIAFMMEAPAINTSANQSLQIKQEDDKSCKKSYPTVATTEKCRVCSEPAAKHMHYGAITCFSCKAFFRRAIQNNVAHDFICRGDNKCDIAIQSRKHCQKCRYRRCLEVGMKPGWVLSKAERQRRFKRKQNANDDSIADDASQVSPGNQELDIKLEDESTSSSKSEKSKLNNGSYNDSDSDSSQESNGSNSNENCLPVELSAPDNEIGQMMTKLWTVYDENYSSVAFGESLLKELIFSSAFGVKISPEASLTAYRLMLTRVTKVAKGLDLFTQLPGDVQSLLLKQNADLMVLLEGVVFFEHKKRGLDQVMSSMGQEDFPFAKDFLDAIYQKIQKLNFNDESSKESSPVSALEHIGYDKFNTIQSLEDQEQEQRFTLLMNRMGQMVSRTPKLMKILSFIALFSLENNSDLSKDHRSKVEHVQQQLVTILETAIRTNLPKPVCDGTAADEITVIWVAKVLGCLPDLRELSHINMKRPFRQEILNILEKGDLKTTG